MDIQFQVTHYVAEYWNTLSNAVLCLGALYGLVQVRKHQMETRYEVGRRGLLTD